MRAFVDRIHDNLATLLLGDDESMSITLPVSCLPEGAKEGAVMRLVFELDSDATAAGSERVSELMDQLGDNP